MHSSGPRVPPDTVLSGDPVEVRGGRNVSWACTDTGTLTVSPSVKATANIVKRDERLNQAMIKVFSGRAGSVYKDGGTAAKVPTHQ
jgi:hypothetical protein